MPRRAPVPAQPRLRQLISLTRAAELLDISVRSVYRRIYDGQLPAYRVGKLIKVDVADVEALITPIPAAAMRGTVGQAVAAAVDRAAAASGR